MVSRCFVDTWDLLVVCWLLFVAAGMVWFYVCLRALVGGVVVLSEVASVFKVL